MLMISKGIALLLLSNTSFISSRRSIEEQDSGVREDLLPLLTVARSYKLLEELTFPSRKYDSELKGLWKLSCVSCSWVYLQTERLMHYSKKSIQRTAAQ